MDCMPNDVLVEILVRVKRGRNSAALVCRRWYEVDRVLRRELMTGIGLSPPELALAALCTRFCNLTTVQLSYWGWISSMGRQVDDASLQTLALGCPHLSNLALNFCSFVTDVGMANLTLCHHLTAVHLNFVPCISGRGLLSLVSGCHSLALLHINTLMNVRVLEWLRFLGNNRKIESLAIRNCKGVGEQDLELLGIRGWQNLREFVYEVDVVQDPSGDFYLHNGTWPGRLNGWKPPGGQDCWCAELRVLSLTHCLSKSGTGVAWILSQCRNLRRLSLDACLGMEDGDLLVLAERCGSQVESISLRVPCHLSGIPKLTDATLLGIAEHCRGLESMELVLAGGDFLPAFTGAGIAAIVERCTRLRVLCVERACVFMFSDSTMGVVCESESLEVLELTRCHDVTDKGLKMVARSNLKKLKLSRCLGLTDAWLPPLKAAACTSRLAYLGVEDCPEISHEAVMDAAQVVSYKCTHPWTH